MDRARLDAALPAYQVGEQIGRRGYGVVFAARHRRLGTQVAVKVLSDRNTDDEIRERSLAEATALGDLDHPHIVRIHDYVEHDDLCLLIMERLTGGMLQTRTGMSAEEACAVVLPVADALDAAHRHGVLHRDIKPENLLYNSDGMLKVVGFGFAKPFDGAASLISAASGTPAYMSPERIQGLPLGPASDLYSLGVLLYELLSSELPFSSELPVAAQLHHHLNIPAPWLSGAPPQLAIVVERALRKGPGSRHGSAYEFEIELAEAAATALGPNWLEQVSSPLRLNGRARDAARGLRPAASAAPVARAHAVPVATAVPSGGSAGVAEIERSTAGRASVPRHASPPAPPPRRIANRVPPPPRDPSAPSGKKPWYRRRWVLAAAAGVIVLGSALVIWAPWGSSGAGTGAINVASPRGIVVDPAGNLYLSDVSNHQVRRISSNGTETVVAGTGVIGSGGDDGPAKDAQLDYPASLALGPSGSIYIADTAQHRIRQVSQDGKITTAVGADPTFTEGDDATDAQAVALPDNFAITASPSGQVYIVESGNSTQQVRRLTGGGVVTVAGGTESSEGQSGDDGFGQVRSVAVDSSGRIYVADRGRHVVWMFTAGGRLTPFAGSGSAADCPGGIIAGGPEAVALGSSNELYVGSYGLCEVTNGSVKALVRGRYIDSVTVAPDGEIYFISQNTIYKLNKANQVQQVKA